uniref:NADH dehydrogenase subunit 2 n=1 Tax=Dactylogyrus tuba TaxID=231340 RepID=UPI002E767349|nr:NADH dehydrogenase subunit 2 [Dactylogyrus tuba]WCF76309.1 NADH dehydrogenase subunit 2 [Dactylogyrus tuba]
MNSLLMVGLSSSLYVASLTGPNLLGFWLATEAAGLVLLAGFFWQNTTTNRYLGLLTYLLACGVSSALMYCGVFTPALGSLLYLGFLIKAGTVPFVGWVMSVYSNSPWLLLYVLAVISKATFLYIPHIALSPTPLHQVAILVTLPILICYLWGSVVGVKQYISVSSVASAAILAYLCFAGDLPRAETLYLVYLLVYSGLFAAFYKLDAARVSPGTTTASVFLFISIPSSLVFLYKIVSVWAVSGLSYHLLTLWVAYSIVEQVYLLLYLLEKAN